MAVPKRRTTRAKRNQRRANHDKVAAPNLIECPNCAELMRPHRICGACGHYKGRQILNVESPLAAAGAEAAEG